MYKKSYAAPELLDLGLVSQLTAALDVSSRTDYDENGPIVTQGLGSRDVCDPDVPEPRTGLLQYSVI